MTSLIAVAGGSCSGKTRISKHTTYALGGDLCVVVKQDNYYRDYGGAALGEPLPNFDHPDAVQWDLLRQHLLLLKSGQAVDIPTYDFATHRRTDITERIQPRPIILVEGILILSQPKLRAVFDHRFFVRCAENIRLERRIKRDTAERGRTESNVRTQFQKQVTPMHEKFVEPSKAHADVVISQDQCELSIITSTGPLIRYCRSVL